MVPVTNVVLVPTMVDTLDVLDIVVLVADRDVGANVVGVNVGLRDSAAANTTTSHQV